MVRSLNESQAERQEEYLVNDKNLDNILVELAHSKAAQKSLLNTILEISKKRNPDSIGKIVKEKRFSMMSKKEKQNFKTLQKSERKLQNPKLVNSLANQFLGFLLNNNTLCLTSDEISIGYKAIYENSKNDVDEDEYIKMIQFITNNFDTLIQEFITQFTKTMLFDYKANKQENPIHETTPLEEVIKINNKSIQEKIEVLLTPDRETSEDVPEKIRIKPINFQLISDIAISHITDECSRKGITLRPNRIKILAKDAIRGVFEKHKNKAIAPSTIRKIMDERLKETLFYEKRNSIHNTTPLKEIIKTNSKSMREEAQTLFTFKKDIPEKIRIQPIDFELISDIAISHITDECSKKGITLRPSRIRALAKDAIRGVFEKHGNKTIAPKTIKQIMNKRLKETLFDEKDLKELKREQKKQEIVNRKIKLQNEVTQNLDQILEELNYNPKSQRMILDTTLKILAEQDQEALLRGKTLLNGNEKITTSVANHFLEWILNKSTKFDKIDSFIVLSKIYKKLNNKTILEKITEYEKKDETKYLKDEETIEKRYESIITTIKQNRGKLMQKFLETFNTNYVLSDKTNSESIYETNLHNLDYKLRDWDVVLSIYGNVRIRNNVIWEHKNYILKHLDLKLMLTGKHISDQEKEDLFNTTMMNISENITRVDLQKGNIYNLIHNYLSTSIKKTIANGGLVSTKSPNLELIKSYTYHQMKKNPERERITPEEIAKNLNLEIKVVKNLLNAQNNPSKYVYSDSPTKEGEGTCKGDLINELHNHETPEKIILNNDLITYINSLPPQAQSIAKMRLSGLNNYQIAETLGKTHQRISQILDALKKAMETPDILSLQETSIEVTILKKRSFNAWCEKYNFDTEETEWIKTYVKSTELKNGPNKVYKKLYPKGQNPEYLEKMKECITTFKKIIGKPTTEASKELKDILEIKKDPDQEKNSIRIINYPDFITWCQKYNFDIGQIEWIKMFTGNHTSYMGKQMTPSMVNKEFGNSDMILKKIRATCNKFRQLRLGIPTQARIDFDKIVKIEKKVYSFSKAKEIYQELLA